MSGKKKTPIERTNGQHHLSGENIHHYRWDKGITTLEVMPFAPSDTKRPNDLKFTSLLEGDMTSVIYSCIWRLSDAGIFKTASGMTGYLDDRTPFIRPKDWLCFEAKSRDGTVLLGPLKACECDDEGNIIDPLSDPDERVPLIALAAKLIWEDQCKRDEIFSQIWYCAKIIELWFWPAYSIVDRAVLIGQLYAEMNIKHTHEDDAMHGKKFTGGPKQTKNATSQKKRDRETRFKLVKAEFQKLTEAELSQYRTQNDGRIKAKPVARHIKGMLRFEDAHVRPIGLDQIALIIQEIIEKSEKPSS